MKSINTKIVLLTLVAVLAPLQGWSAEDKETAKRLHQFFDAEWEYNLKEHPTFATSLGDPRYNDRWTDLSLDAIAKRKQHDQQTLEKLKSFDRGQLSSADQLNYDLALRNATISVEEDKFPFEYWQIGPVRTPTQELADLVARTRLAKEKDYTDLIKRLQAFPAHVDQVILLLRKGLEKGITPPRMTLSDLAKNIERHLPSDPTQSPVYQTAFKEFPSSIPAADQTRLREKGLAVLRDAVFPAIRKLRDFVATEYEPKARTAIAFSALPNGKAWYALRVKTMTTTELSPEEIHRIGLSEVARIRSEMEKLMRQTSFQGDLPAFFKFLKTDPQFFFTDKDLLLITYRDIAKRIDGQLPKLFGKLPRQPYGVLPVPAHSEKVQTTAYYERGSAEAARAGVFYANTYDLKTRPKWEMEALTLHEAVPGHHLQLALAEELEMPKFRRFGGYTAYIEGWGLYSESLGSELGMYKDTYSKFGQLTYEMWRAIRLVVDTGMHSLGWSRDQARQFFRDNTGKTDHDIEVEVDRYINWPAQALAYKLGELKFKELRTFASKELGERFDIREFHDQVLADGALPLSTLDSRIRAWVAKKKSAAAQSEPTKAGSTSGG
jgi:uncharacterized protein (DUF885 family)